MALGPVHEKRLATPFPNPAKYRKSGSMFVRLAPPSCPEGYEKLKLIKLHRFLFRTVTHGCNTHGLGGSGQRPISLLTRRDVLHTPQVPQTSCRAFR